VVIQPKLRETTKGTREQNSTQNGLFGVPLVHTDSVSAHAPKAAGRPLCTIFPSSARLTFSQPTLRLTKPPEEVSPKVFPLPPKGLVGFPWDGKKFQPVSFFPTLPLFLLSYLSLSWLSPFAPQPFGRGLLLFSAGWSSWASPASFDLSNVSTLLLSPDS